MQLDAIWNRARADLVATTEHGDEDVFLWEHAVRVAENARRIAMLPVVQEASPDETAVVAAALYHDAGWIVRLRNGEIKRDEILIRPMSESHREQGAALMERSLSPSLSRDSLTRASQAIRALNDRRIEPIEGQVVCEADNLEEFGVLSLWSTIRRSAIDGKGVQTLLETWRRRKEYRFWEARLNDSFRFAAVRAVAERRLEQFESLMEELERQHKGVDLGLDLAPSPADRLARSTKP